MPGRDGRGPLGEGPMTGQRNGRCADGGSPFAGRGFRKLGMGRRNGGFGGYRFNATDEKSYLDSLISGLSNQLEILRKRRENLGE